MTTYNPKFIDNVKIGDKVAIFRTGSFNDALLDYREDTVVGLTQTLVKLESGLRFSLKTRRILETKEISYVHRNLVIQSPEYYHSLLDIQTNRRKTSDAWRKLSAAAQSKNIEESEEALREILSLLNK